MNASEKKKESELYNQREKSGKNGKRGIILQKLFYSTESYSNQFMNFFIAGTSKERL